MARKRKLGLFQMLFYAYSFSRIAKRYDRRGVIILVGIVLVSAIFSLAR